MVLVPYRDLPASKRHGDAVSYALTGTGHQKAAGQLGLS